LLTAVVDAGKKRLNANARFDHPDKLTFNVSSNAMALGEISFARRIEPDLKGIAQIKTDGVIRFGRQLDVVDLNADIRTTGLTLGVRALGDAHLTAETKNGLMTARFDSNVAKSAIHGDGTVTLGGDYPVNAKLTFSNLGLSAVAAAMRGPTEGKDLNLDPGDAVEVVSAHRQRPFPSSRNGSRSYRRHRTELGIAFRSASPGEDEPGAGRDL
jgi:hypothetical protein